MALQPSVPTGSLPIRLGMLSMADSNAIKIMRHEEYVQEGGVGLTVIRVTVRSKDLQIDFPKVNEIPRAERTSASAFFQDVANTISATYMLNPPTPCRMGKDGSNVVLDTASYEKFFIDAMEKITSCALKGTFIIPAPYAQGVATTPDDILCRYWNPLDMNELIEIKIPFCHYSTKVYNVFVQATYSWDTCEDWAYQGPRASILCRKVVLYAANGKHDHDDYVMRLIQEYLPQTVDGQVIDVDGSMKFVDGSKVQPVLVACFCYAVIQAARQGELERHLGAKRLVARTAKRDPGVLQLAGTVKYFDAVAGQYRNAFEIEGRKPEPSEASSSPKNVPLPKRGGGGGRST